MSETLSSLPAAAVSSRWRNGLLYFLLAALVIAGGWEGLRFADLRLSLGRARREFAQREFKRAEFWACRAAGMDGGNIEAMRLMAEINEAQDKPDALAWRMRVAQRAPGSVPDIMAWAKCALRFGRAEMAARALKSLPAEFKNRSAEFNEIMAGCALADHEIGLAEACFARAAELGPGDPVNRVNLEAFRLANSPFPEVRSAAARELEGLLSDARVTLFAVRPLLADAVRSGDRPRAQRFAEKLRSISEHDFTDDLSCLDAAMISGSGFHPALEAVEDAAESDVFRTAEMGDWLNGRGMAGETLDWYARLPKPVQSNARTQIMASEAYLALYDWQGLASFLANRRWDECEYLRRAMLIRCKRELSQPWESDWKQLVADVEANPPDSLLLAQLVIGWNWRNETLDLLWDASTRPGTATKALQYLWGLYAPARDTVELLRVAKAQIALDPSNPAKQNDYAFLSLLVVGASDNSERLAEEATTANPNVPEWVATYAFALHLAGKEAQAKKVMDRLPPEALKRPGVALYYAIVLAGNGDYARARESMEKLNPDGMLPEERKLAEELAQQLNLASR